MSTRQPSTHERQQARSDRPRVSPKARERGPHMTL